MQKIQKINEQFQPHSQIVQKAYIDDISRIHEIYIGYLDKYSELIPLKEELDEVVEQSSLYVIKENEKIHGLICFEKTGRTSHLKEWFIMPEYRNKGLGSKLLKQYFWCTRDCDRHILWVKKSESRAIDIYKL